MEKAAAAAAAAAAPLHPYYPLGLELAGFESNEWSVPLLVSGFLGAWGVMLLITLVLVNHFQPSLSKTDKAMILWFVLTGAIHFFFEGYFAYNHTRMVVAQDLFGQLWKEYSLADSRYLTSDPFVLCMETITAVAWGPLSFVTAFLIARKHSLRHPIQAIVSLGQIYGDVLYYATSLFDFYYTGVEYCRPEPYYFWFYYFFMNFLWIVIPGFCLYQSVSASSRAFKALDKMSQSLQANGNLKKAQ